MNRTEMLEKLKVGEDPLEISIKKWRDIVEGEGKDNGVKNCALCKVYEGCCGCPVKSETGLKYCDGTPYEMYEDMYDEGLSTEEELEEAAMAELEFLISLRGK